MEPAVGFGTGWRYGAGRLHAAGRGADGIPDFSRRGRSHRPSDSGHNRVDDDNEAGDDHWGDPDLGRDNGPNGRRCPVQHQRQDSALAAGNENHAL